MSLALPDYNPNEELLRRALMSRAHTVNTVGRLPAYDPAEEELPDYVEPTPPPIANVASPAVAPPPLPGYEAPAYGPAPGEMAVAGTEALPGYDPVNAALSSGARGAAMGARSGSLGQATGGFLGGLASWALNRKQIKKDTLQGQADEATKRKRDEEEHDATIAQKKAQTTNLEAQPGDRDDERRRKENEGDRRLTALETKNAADEAYKKGQNEERARANKERETDRDADRTSREGEGDKNRKARAELTQLLIDSRETIAAKQREAVDARAKVKTGGMSESQFKKTFPGFGRSLTKDDVIRKAVAGNKTLLEAKTQAIGQGYTIQD